MSAHVMRIEWEGGHTFPRYTVVCNEPAEALCRAEFPCDCEEYAAVGLGDDGLPWHELTEGYMNSDQFALHLLGETPRHVGKPGGDCTYALWLNESDCVDELGHGTADIPVTFKWDGDGYEWTAGSAS